MFGQVLAGAGRATATLGLNSYGTTGFILQPGFGAEVAMRPNFALRPQFDLMMSHADGGWGHDVRVNVSAVFVLFR